MILRIHFEEMVYDDEQHRRASEKDCERVELGIGNHLDCVGAWNVARRLVEELRNALRSCQ